MSGCGAVCCLLVLRDPGCVLCAGWIGIGSCIGWKEGKRSGNDRIQCYRIIVSTIVWRVSCECDESLTQCQWRSESSIGIAKYVYDLDHTHVRLSQALHIKPRTRAVRSPQSGLVSHIDIRTRAHSRLGDRRPPQPSCTPMVSSPMVRSVVIGPTCAHTTPSLSASGNSTSSSPCPSRARPARAAQAAAWSAALRAPPQTPRTPPPSSNAPP